ncbi:MAG: hypothetical protein FWD57_03530 [Polyangiaceae bacterium]|nr:hypothetical protein [Polyangiaceae bacterium]
MNRTRTGLGTLVWWVGALGFGCDKSHPYTLGSLVLTALGFGWGAGFGLGGWCGGGVGALGFGCDKSHLCVRRDCHRSAQSINIE